MSEQQTGKRISVAKLPKKTISKDKALRLLATLCYFYPQYTLAAARRLPWKHVLLLLKVANQQEAIKQYNLVQIVSAPHTKKGEGVKKLSNQFKKDAQDG